MNLPASRWAQEQLEILDNGWERCMSLINSLGPDGLETNLTSSWTIKEMIAHLAFWEEVSLPVIQGIYRGGPDVPIAEWYGGTDLELSADVPWPDADTHNAREARWARSKSSQEGTLPLNSRSSKTKVHRCHCYHRRISGSPRRAVVRQCRMPPCRPPSPTNPRSQQSVTRRGKLKKSPVV